MAHILEHRHGPDRRRQPRGGRRAEDLTGTAPLVLLIGEKPGVVERSEAILAKLRFAVSTSDTVEEALRVLPGLRPDLVVAAAGDADRIRLEAPEHLPVVVTQESGEALVDEVRRALRLRKPDAEVM
jgi:hypothetical protein